MAFPLFRLRTLQICAIQKFILAMIFSLAIFIIAIDIARVVPDFNGVAANDSAIAFGIVEPTVAVIVSCLPHYGSLLRSTKAKPTHHETWPGRRRLGAPATSVELGHSMKESQDSVEGTAWHDEAGEGASRSQSGNGSTYLADRSNPQPLGSTIAKE